MILKRQIRKIQIIKIIKYNIRVQSAVRPKILKYWWWLCQVSWCVKVSGQSQLTIQRLLDSWLKPQTTTRNPHKLVLALKKVLAWHWAWHITTWHDCIQLNDIDISWQQNSLLTNFCQRGHKDPESDDEWNLHSLKFHVEDVILRGVSMMTVVAKFFFFQGVLRTVFK